MAYDFHYTPTGTGVISGKEVLEQTEDAINDLGNTAISGVQEALDKAEQALTNSENAVDDAQTALNTANNAEGVAIQAQNDVSNLSGTVTNIGNRVTTAEGNISNLQGRMTTAEGNITNLQGRMTTAESNIGNLQTAVSTAQATANSAQQTATIARQQSYVLRYSSSSVTDNSTIAYSTLDNTDNVKTGDKVIDVDGKIFSIVSVDTTNQTVTVGTALIDLALDGNVVHTSGDESISGIKRFGVVQNFTGYPSIRLYNLTDEVGVLPSAHQQKDIRFTDKNNVPIAYLLFQHRNDASEPFRTCWRQCRLDGTDNYYSVNFNNLGEFYPENNNAIKLGTSVKRWADVYATNYYYGSNNVEFSTKFVTTDTAQTITETKTFTNTIKSQKEIEFTGNRLAYILPEFSASYSGLSLCTYGSSGAVKIGSWKVDDNDNTKHVLDTSLGYLNVTTGSVNSINSVYLTPRNATDSKLGDSTNKWKQINGLTPSSLGMPVEPSSTSYVDISGYITVFDSSSVNTYTPPSNGYITFSVIGNLVQIFHNYGLQGKWTVQAGNVNRGFIPVLGGVEVKIYVTASNIDKFWFIPCQGNI